MYEVGLSSCGHILDDAYFASFQKAGIRYMEVSPGEDDYANVDYLKIKALAKTYDVGLWSFHLPYWPFDTVDLSNPPIAKRTVGYFKELIQKAADIGIDKFVLHASGEPIEDIEERKTRMACAKESLFALAEFAKTCGAQIAVEDLPRSCLGRNSDDILDLISAHDDLRVCFDTNHLLSENPADFVRRVGNKIITTHVSDCDFINERHWLPGEGKIDWQALLGAFSDIGYQGIWLYEIGFHCPRSIIRDRDLTCEDFVRNANEIFQNKPITTFSTHIEGLGMWV